MKIRNCTNWNEVTFLVWVLTRHSTLKTLSVRYLQFATWDLSYSRRTLTPKNYVSGNALKPGYGKKHCAVTIFPFGMNFYLGIGKNINFFSCTKYNEHILLKIVVKSFLITMFYLQLKHSLLLTSWNRPYLRFG